MHLMGGCLLSQIFCSILCLFAAFPGPCLLPWVLLIHLMALPCILWASCDVMIAPVLFPVCPHTFHGFPLVSWGAPGPSPGCFLPSLGCPCCLCSKTHHPMTSAQTCSSVDLRIRHVGCHELLRKSSLVCLVCFLAISLRSDEWIASTSRLKHLHAINSFGLKGACSAPVALLLYEL